MIQRKFLLCILICGFLITEKAFVQGYPLTEETNTTLPSNDEPTTNVTVKEKRQFILLPSQPVMSSYPSQPMPTIANSYSPPPQLNQQQIDSKILQQVAIDLIRIVQPLLETAAALNNQTLEVAQ